MALAATTYEHISLDENGVPVIAVTLGLRLRDIDTLTACEDDCQLGDPALLDRATELRRVLFSMDSDLLMEGRKGSGPARTSRESSTLTRSAAP